MFPREGENAMCQLNSSAQFCKMSVDFYFEEVRPEKRPRRGRRQRDGGGEAILISDWWILIIPSCDWLIGGGGGDNWMVTLFIEGEPVADAKGIKKNIKYTVAEAAMEYLRCSVV